MRFEPSVWGPIFWHTIHIVAIGYSKHPTYTDKKCAKEFFESLTFLIPCSICRDHYKIYLAEKPITPFLDSKTDLIKWTVDIHNEVNKKLGKPTWTLEEVMRYYERLGERNRSPIWTQHDMNEIDHRSFIKGFIVSSFICGVLAGSFFIANRINV